MKQIALILAVAVSLPVLAKGSHSSGGGAHHVAGHTTKKGTYVQPHRQTDPNKTKRDNWSSKGNTNPDTGKQGTKDPNK